MAAVKSDNPLHAEINKNFNIIVYEFVGTEEVETESGSEVVTHYKYAGINSANEVSAYIADEKLKIKLFNKALDSGWDKHTMLVRNRLKLNFYSK